MKNSKAMVFAGMGFELFAVVLGALLIGPIIDEAMGTKSIGTLILLFMCIIGWLIHFVHLVTRYAKETKNENSTD